MAADAKRRQAEALERDANFAAQKLVERVDRIIGQGGWSVSSNFPNDRQYGTKDSGNLETAPAAVISRAGKLWENKGPAYSFRAPKAKKQWDGLLMANFEKLIHEDGDKPGKHNVHIVPT